MVPSVRLLIAPLIGLVMISFAVIFRPAEAKRRSLAASQAVFTPGDLALFQADSASANNTTFSIVELSSSAPGSNPVQTIGISGTGANAMRTSGSATSTGYLATTSDGTLLSFDAHNSATTAGNANALTARGVGTLNSAGGFTLATAYTGSNGNQARGATSLNNANWFIADQGGIYTNGAVAASPAGNVRGIKSFGGVVYTLQQSSTPTTIVVSTVSAPSGGTITGLPGLTNNNAAQDFYLISSGDNGAVYDVLYVNTNTSATAGTILKFSLVGGNWVANGSYTTTFGGFGLAAADNGSGAFLYVSSGAGATAANNVIKLADTAGYNATISITTANNVTLYTAPAGTTIKGVAFAPIGDAAPAVTTTSPTNGATGVAANSTITINFTELVNLTVGAVSVECPSGSPQTFTGLPASNVNTVTLTPSAALPGGTICTVTVVANQVNDADAIDLPDLMADNYVFSFTTIAAANTPPTIVANTATTTSYLNVSATGPSSASGVITDPTDPAATLGIDFSIGDGETAAGSLGFAATSSNSSVVPNNAANLVLSGSGASRNLKIFPTGVGYSTITVAVTDAASATATYTINFAASAASITPATTRFHTVVSDGSAAVAVDSNFMFVADDENQGLRLFNRTNSGLPSYSLDPTTLLDMSADPGHPEVDIEAATLVGSRIYWISSHGNSSSGSLRPNRYRIFATDITGSGALATLSYVGRYDGLRTDLINWDTTNAHGLGANHYGLAASAAAGKIPEEPDGSGFNIEGLVMAPGSTTTAYVCFRAPISPATSRTKALLIPVTNFNTLVAANPTAGPATFGPPIELNLGGRGIRDVAKNSSDQYLIVAGPVAEATGVPPNDFRLYTWTGNPGDAPALRSADLSGLHPEAIVEVPAGLSAASTVQLISDDGDTILYNDGTIAKELPQNNFKKFRSDIVTLGSASPTAANSRITGQITDSNGRPLAGVVITLSGTQTRKTITDASGTYSFEDVETSGFYSVTPSLTIYRFSPEVRSFSLLGNSTSASFTATREVDSGGAVIDTPEYFVRQHYLDFLGREPDESGFNFWSDQILSCGSDADCTERRTINVSAAYFLSIEFQQTGGLVDGVYRASYGRAPSYAEFTPATAVVAQGVVVGRIGWAQALEANKQAFLNAWLQRPDFQAAYEGLTNAAFVERLTAQAGASFNGNREALVSGLNNGTMTRAAVLGNVVENEGFVQAKRNRMFVMMQYFGYLRRDPDASGYEFWLNKLDEFNGNFERAEMVKAFLVSGEYRERFRQ